MPTLPGAGAAGGLGAGLVAFLGAELRSGVQTVMDAVRLRERMAGADLAITAEGRLDGQSAFGKATAGVIGAAREARRARGRAWPARSGRATSGSTRRASARRSASPTGRWTSDAAMARAAELLERAAESVMRVWLAAGGAAHA